MRTRVLAGLGVVLLAAVAVPAQGALYMKLSGVKGDVTAEGYWDDIAIGSFALSATSPVVIDPRAGATRPGMPEFSDLGVTAQGSAASVAILQQLLSGRPFDTLNLYVTRPSRDGREVTVAEWDFEEAYVTSFGTSSAGDRPGDAYQFAFGAFTYQWFNFDGKDMPTGHVEVGYDRRTGKQTASLMEGDVTGFALVTSVPEPGCAAAAVVGALGVLGGRRRRG